MARDTSERPTRAEDRKCVKTQAAQSKPARPDGSADAAAADLGRSLRAARERAGLTQEQLSSRTGIRQPFVSRIESGHANPSVSTLAPIASALGTRLDVVDTVGVTNEWGGAGFPYFRCSACGTAAQNECIPDDAGESRPLRCCPGCGRPIDWEGGPRDE